MSCKAKRGKDRGDGAWGRVRELVEMLRAQGTITYIQTPREAPPAKAPRGTFAALIFSKSLHASHHGDSQMKCSCRCDAHFSDQETNPDVILVGGRTTHITLYRNLLSGLWFSYTVQFIITLCLRVRPRNLVKRPKLGRGAGEGRELKGCLNNTALMF